MGSRFRESPMAKWLGGRLEDMRDGIVLVEGLHDKAAAADPDIDVNAVTFAEFMAGAEKSPSSVGIGTGKTFYVMMDRDRGGADKEEKAVSALTRADPHAVYNTSLARRFFGLLHITSFEQAPARVRRVLRTE